MSERFVTRKELAELVNTQLGIPLTKSRINKLAMQRKGPPVAGRYGPADLIDPVKGMDWARRTFANTDDGEAV